MIDAGVSGPLRWAAVGRERAGEAISGDRHVVVPAPDGVLVAVIDGLGHGPEAAEAAEVAATTLASAGSASASAAMLLCHRALAHTRGAVISIARVRGTTLGWVGVGNVEGIRVPGINGGSTRERLSLSGGVVGHTLPALREATLPIGSGDLLVFGTDGLAPDFSDRLDALASPEALAQQLVTRYATGRDDVLAFAARYDGGG